MKKEDKFFIIAKNNNLLNEDDLIKKSYWISWGLIGADLLIMGLVWNVLPKTIPLFYSLSWGEARLANKIWLGLLPGLGLVFTWLNLSLSQTLWKQNKFLQKLMAVVSLTESGWFSLIMLGIISIMI